MPEQIRYFYTDTTKTRWVGANGESGLNKLREKYPNAIETDTHKNILENEVKAATQPQYSIQQPTASQQSSIPPMLARPSQQPQEQQPSLSLLPSLPTLQQPEDNNEYLYPKTGEDSQKDLLFEQIRDNFNTGRKAAEEKASEYNNNYLRESRSLFHSDPEPGNSISSERQVATNEMNKITDPAPLISAAIEKELPAIQQKVSKEVLRMPEYKELTERLNSYEVKQRGNIHEYNRIQNAIQELFNNKFNQEINSIYSRIIKEEYVDKNKYNSTVGYIFGEGIRNSLIGKLAEWSNYAGTSGMQRQINDQIAAEYDPSWLTQATAGAVGLITDAPLFAVGGGIGAAAGKPLVNFAVKQGAKGIATRGGGTIASEVATQMAAKRFIPQAIGAAARTSGALATYDAANDVLNQQKAIQLGQQEAYNPLQTLKEAGKGAATGAIVGPLGAGTGKLIGMTASKLAKGVTWTGGFAAENAAFVGSGAVLDGRPITVEDFLQSVVTLGIMKGQHITKATIKERMAPRERFGSTNYNTERAFNIQKNENFFTPEERIDLIRHGVVKKDFVDGIAQAAQHPEILAEIMKDPEVAYSTKMKLRYVLSGKQADRIPYINHINTYEKNGKHIVETRDGSNGLIERKIFNSRANAKDFEKRMIEIAVDQTIMLQEEFAGEAGVRAATEKVKTISKLSDTQLEKIFKKDPAQRTAQERAVVEKYSEALAAELQNSQQPAAAQQSQLSLMPQSPDAKTIAQKIIRGNQEWTPEELQYQQNNPKEVEQEIRAAQIEETINSASHKSGAIIVAADAEGNQYFVKDGDPSNPNGTLIVFNAQTGESKQLSPKDLQFQELTAEQYRQVLNEQSMQSVVNPPSPSGEGQGVRSPLTEPQAQQLISTMEQNAEPMQRLEFTPENWKTEFGENGILETPIGQVKMGGNQYEKIIEEGREEEWGMIKPTLTNPDVIVEEPSKAKDGQETERPSSYVFIKTFNRDGKKIKFFTTITINKEGFEIAISSHYKELSKIRRALTAGRLLYTKDALRASVSDPTLLRQPAEAVANAGTSTDKATNNSANNQIPVEKLIGQTITLNNGIEYTIKGRDENGNIVMYFENEQGMPEMATMTEADFNAAMAAQQTPAPQQSQGLNASESSAANPAPQSQQAAQPKTFEIDKGVTATENPDGTFSLNKTFPKSELGKAEKLIKKLNADYEDNGMSFELAELPKQDEANPFEKPLWGVIAKPAAVPQPSQEPQQLQGLNGLKSSEVNQKEKEEAKSRVRDWISKENLEKATGKTRAEIFDEFGNELEPIAIIDNQYLPYLGNDITDNHVYSGKGYLIDHAVNNHPNISIKEYDKIQDILDNPDDIKLDAERENPSLIFIKQYDKYGSVVVNANVGENGKIVFHKTFFMQERKPYASLPSIRHNSSSLEDDTLLNDRHSSISPADAPAAAVSRFSGLNDSSKSTTNISNTQNKIETSPNNKTTDTMVSDKQGEGDTALSSDNVSTDKDRNNISDTQKILSEKEFLAQQVFEYVKSNNININEFEDSEEYTDVINSIINSYPAYIKELAETGELQRMFDGANLGEEIRIKNAVEATGLKLSDLINTEARKEAVKKAREGKKVADKKAKNKTIEEALGINLGAETGASAATPSTYQQLVDDVAAQTDSPSTSVDSPSSPETQTRLQAVPSASANQAAYDFDVSGITEANAREMQRIKTEAQTNGTFMKAPNGKPTNLNERQWLQVRTPHFKEWFGNWELKYQKVTPVTATKNRFKNFADARSWAEENIVGILSNEQTGGKGDIEITKDAIKKFFSSSATEKSDNTTAHKDVIAVLPEVIKNSIVGEIHLDYIKESNVRRPENGIVPGTSIHRLFGAVNIDGVTYRVKTTVRYFDDVNTENKAHSYEVTKIELLAGNMANTDNSTDPNTNNSISLSPNRTANTVSPIEAAKLLNGVEKSYEKGRFILDDHSKVVDANGEPMAMHHGTKKNFTVFDREKNLLGNGGFYFTSSEREYPYKNVMPVFLNIKNPADSFNKISWHKGFEENTEKYDGSFESRSYGNNTKWATVANPSQIKSATANNGNFDTRSDDIRYQFIGEKGAANLDKAQEATTRMDNLRVAKEMERSYSPEEIDKARQMAFEAIPEELKNDARKVNRDEDTDGSAMKRIQENPKAKEAWSDYIRALERRKTAKLGKEERQRIKLATGWERGADGKWRYEVLDFKSINKEVYNLLHGGETYNTVKLPALIGENDDLFKSYPQLKELNIARNDIDSSGVFSPGGNVQITINENLTSLSAKSTLIHEIQHAIQDIEGFAQGTSPNIDHRDRQIKDLNEAYALVDDKVRRYIELKGKERYGGIDKMPIDEVVELSKLEKDEAVKKVDNSLREVFKKYGSNMDVVSFENGQAESFYKDASTRRYFKSAGEVEARNASHRRNMTPEERRASLASETEDVAREDQIFLYDTLGEQAMAEEANLEIVNTRFNEELDTLTPENARSKTLWLGNPSVTLQSAGIKNKALKLYGAKLLSKAKKHSFNFNDLKNLPNAVQSPIAVFKGSVEGSHAILTELNINGNNVLVTLNIGKGEDVDFNIISSTYGKSSEGIVGWVNNGKMLYVDKEKTLNYLRISAPIAEAQDNTRLPESNPDDLGSLALNNASAINSQELNSATKIVQNFQNPKLSGENSHISDKKFTPISRKQAEALAGLLKKSGLAKDVVFGQEELAKVVGAGFKPVQSPQNIRLLSTPAGEIYGAVKDGVVYLDDTKLNANTPIHEFGHLWNDLVKKDNPQLWAKIVELAKETPYFKELLNNPAYANLDNDDARADEAFAQAMGDEGERIFNDPNAPKSIKERFKQLLKDFWEWLGRKLGIRNLSPGQISKLNFGQAVKGAVADITSGKPITFKDVVEKVTQPKNNITEKPLSLRDVINEKGEINYDQLRSISRTIEQGNYSTQYFTEEVERSRAAGGRRNVEASLILGGSQSANAEKQQALLEQYFEHEGLLYDLADYMDKNQDRFLNDALNNAEAVVFRSNDGKSVEKFINYRINSDTPFDFINNRVVLHNHLFIETKYELIGAAKFNGQFFFMVKQPFIKGIATENREEFYRHMKERGYEENDLQLNAFHDKFFKISDLHEENVLKGDDGNFYFIDTVPEYKDGNLEFSIEPNKPAAPSRFSEVFDGVTEENTTFAPSEQNLTIAQMLEGTTPVETPKHSFKSLNEARQWAKENIVGTYKNDNIGENLNISKTAIDKYLSMKAVKKSVNMDAHLSALKQLPKLIETSVLKETHPDKGDDINIKEIQRLYGAIDYERQTYPVKITVKVIKSGENNAYSYEVMEIENPDEQLSHPGSSSVGDIGDLVPKSDDFLPQSTEFSISKGTNNSETAKTDLQNSQKNNTFAKNSSDESKTKLGNKRTMGSSTLRGLVGIEPQGRRIEQALAESNRRGSGGTAESSLQTGWDKDRFLASLEVSTRANGTWIDDIKSIADSRLIGGFENEPYISKDGKTVIKVNNFAFLNDNDTQYEHTRDFNYFVDRLNAHNELFPKDKYKIIGFAENSKGEVSVVLQQPFVRDAELASTAQIEAWLHENGFKRTVKPDGFVYYTNGKYELSDIKPQNVLVDTNGDLRFIDLDIVPVKEQGARFQISPKAKRQYTAGELQMTPDQLASPEPPTTPAKKIQKRGTGLVEAIVDKHQRLKNTIREIEKRTGTKVAAKDNPYDRLTKLSARAQAALEDFKNKTSEPLLNRIRSMTKHIPDVWPSADIQKHAAIAKTSPFVQLFLADTDIRRTFDFYMMAKHAPHRNAYIEKKTNGGVQNGSGITNDEAAAVIDIFEKQFTAKEIDDFWEDVEKATDTSLNAWLDTGRITKETYDELKKEMPYFVPLRNWDDSETDKSIDAIYSGGGNDTYSAYKQAEGRSTIADSPLAYIANLAQSAIVFKEKNDVKRMLFDLAAKARQSDLMQTKKIYTIETLDAAGNVVATRETTTDPRKDTVHPLAPNERVVTKSMGTKNAISPYLASQHEVEAWINGKKYMLEFADEQVAREINEEANAVAQALQKTIGRVTKGMASLMTQKNPVFWTKNTIRDVQHAAIRLGVMYDGKMALTFMKSLPRATQVAFMMQFADKATGAHSSDPVLQKFINYGEEYRKSGARVGFMQMLDIDRIKKDIDKSLKHVGDINNRNFLKKGLRAINGMAAVSEDISRLAAFIAARETGRDVSEASNIAKEVTVNFNRSGKYSGIPGSLYAFFNATVQAGANWTEMFRKHPVKAGIAAAIHAALGYFMYMLSSWLLTSDDGDGDELRNLSSYRKYISLFLPAGDNGFAQFPLSQTWRPLYAVGVAAAQIQKGELTPQEAAAGVWEQIANISPIELSGNWEQLLPTAVTPIVETFITKRNYMGAPLVAYEYNDPDGKTVPFHKRGVRTDQLPLWQNMVDILVWGDESTGRKNYNNQETGIPEELHGLDISPDQLRHLVISYTGGLGSAVNDVANLTYSLITGSGASPNKIPIVSSYYSEAKPGYYTDKYYRLRTVFDKFEKNLNYDKDTGRMVEYAGAPEFSEMQTTIGEMEAGQIEIDAVRGKSLKKVYEIWDAQEKKMQKFSAADMAGTKDKDAIRKEVERISKETVNAVEPIFRELGIKY